jgi:hypothetical protein
MRESSMRRTALWALAGLALLAIAIVFGFATVAISGGVYTGEYLAFTLPAAERTPSGGSGVD